MVRKKLKTSSEQQFCGQKRVVIERGLKRRARLVEADREVRVAVRILCMCACVCVCVCVRVYLLSPGCVCVAAPWARKASSRQERICVPTRSEFVARIRALSSFRFTPAMDATSLMSSSSLQHKERLFSAQHNDIISHKMHILPFISYFQLVFEIFLSHGIYSFLYTYILPNFVCAEQPVELYHSYDC